ncbi:PKD domain-containing protein [Methanobacterium sp.]|uniref:PKD domain-containing protein n=1 Tax=Methanobacterium sp. TaxID=2164 RepID=UPI003C78D345
MSFRNKKISVLLTVFVTIFCISALGSVSAASPPYANFNSNVTSGSAPLSVQFNETTIGNVSTWNWNFGDNKSSTLKNPTHTYLRGGEYNVTLTVSNVAGIDSTTKFNYITVYENRFINPGFEIGNLTGWTVGSTTDISTVSHNGTNAVYFQGNSNSSSNYIEQNIDLTNIGSISFWGMEKEDVLLGDIGQFSVYIDNNLIQMISANSTDYNKYIIPTMNYTGLHNITVSWNDVNSAYLDDFFTTLKYPAPVSNFTITTTPTIPNKIQFNFLSKGYIDTLKWNFGDGTTSTETNPLHYYTKNGKYTIILTTTGPGGSTTLSKTITLTNVDTTKPTATASVASGLYNTTQVVKLSISEHGIIYFTTNGKTPTDTSQKYTGPIRIASSTTLKFIAVDRADNYSQVYTKTYKIDKVAPTIVSTTPQDYTKGYSKTSAVSFKFSENIKTGINWSKISVINLNTGKVVTINAKTIKNNILYIQTVKRLSNDWYQVYIPTGAVKDYAGNKGQNAYFYFRT